MEDYKTENRTWIILALFCFLMMGLYLCSSAQRVEYEEIETNKRNVMQLIQKYEISWKHIPSHMKRTPRSYIPSEITVLTTKPQATYYDLQVAIAKELRRHGVRAENVIIDYYKEINHVR